MASALVEGSLAADAVSGSAQVQPPMDPQDVVTLAQATRQPCFSSESKAPAAQCEPATELVRDSTAADASNSFYIAPGAAVPDTSETFSTVRPVGSSGSLGLLGIPSTRTLTPDFRTTTDLWDAADTSAGVQMPAALAGSTASLSAAPPSTSEYQPLQAHFCSTLPGSESDSARETASATVVRFPPRQGAILSTGHLGAPFPNGAESQEEAL